MKGAFFIVILLAMLIVGALVAKNMQTGTEPGTDKMDAIRKAEDAAERAEKTINKTSKSVEEAMKKYTAIDK